MITWNEQTYNNKKYLNDKIIKARNTILDPNDVSSDAYYTKALQSYTKRRTKIVIWYKPNEHMLMFRFYFEHFSWNVCDIATTGNVDDALHEIWNEIQKEFPELYDSVDFITHIECQRYWTHNHATYFSI